ncbi:hypothetical protein ASZ90_009071 [hydrocarbon metagenome]|uniref:Uncharacterized protein n=1 Tax=hydrocarbon metagenome TaxID=938273 RepID=A0A0W8FJU2_9ZZZZ
MSPGPQAYGMQIDGDAHHLCSYKTPMKPPEGAAGATDEHS